MENQLYKNFTSQCTVKKSAKTFIKGLHGFSHDVKLCVSFKWPLHWLSRLQWVFMYLLTNHANFPLDEPGKQISKQTKLISTQIKRT